MRVVRKKIVLFADVLEENFDGVSITLHKILRSIPKDMFEVLVVTSHPPVDRENFPHEILECPYISLPFQKGYRLGVPNVKKLSKALDDFQPDLIHFTSPSFFAYLAIKYGRRKGIPVMNIYHTHYPAYLKYYIGTFGDFLFGGLINQLIAWCYKRADLTLVPTKPIKKDLVKLNVAKNKMIVWGRAIETGQFNPDFKEDGLFDLVIPKENRKVLFVSRLIKEKETAKIYKVYKKLQKVDKTVSMIITGDGPKRDWMEARMPKAIFTGKRVGNELAKIYASCDLFFFPSTSETFGNVIIEAMASGLPVVSADAGGPSEIVKHKKTGFLVKSGKSKDFVAKILLVLNDRGISSTMSENAEKFIKSKSIDSLHAQLWDIYHDLIERNKNTQLAYGKIDVSLIRASVPSVG